MKKNTSKIFSSGEHKLVSLAKFGAFVFTKPGLALIRKIVSKKLSASQPSISAPIDYNTWLAEKAGSYKQNKDGVKICILLTDVTAGETMLVRAVSSVLDQSYQNWELIIAHNNAGAQLTALAAADDRIAVTTQFGDSDAPAAAAAAAAMATGDYLLWMRSDDVLAPWCLSVLAAHISDNPAEEVIYADEDHIDVDGMPDSPYFKPGWSPDTLLSRNYIGHNIVAKRSLAMVAANAADSYYDLSLRLTEQATHVGHIALVLFHCHIQPFSDTGEQMAKKALTAALQRRDLAGEVSSLPEHMGCYRINYTPETNERVSIIIPTKDNTELLQKTIDSILQRTDYVNYEIIVLNNNSTSPAFFLLMEEYTKAYPAMFRCVAASFPFNFAQLMNMGAQLSTGAYLLMCNNDIEVLHADWMTQMVAQASQQHTGAVGARLLFPNDTIQHAGIVLGGAEGSEHLFAHEAKDATGYFGSLIATTNYAAVTAACLMCRRSLYEQAGGMDEALAVEYNDVDLCLRFLDAGCFNVLLSSVTLYHHESATRGHPFRSKASWQQHERELKLFTSRWQALIAADPYFNCDIRRSFRFARVSATQP